MLGLMLFLSPINRITTQGKLCEAGTGLLNKELIDSDKCYMLDCGSEIFVWMGKSTTMTERRTSTSATEVTYSLEALPASSIYT